MADASAIVDYLLRTAGAPDLGEMLLEPATRLHAPALCDIEICASLRRGLLARALSEDRAHAALLAFLDLPITRHGHGALLGAVLALRHNFSAYDAAYVALAQALDGELLTTDRSLARAASKHVRIA